MRKLTGDLERQWSLGHSSPESGREPLSEPKVATFVYGYSTFSGKRGNYRVSVTVATFPHALTSLLEEGEHKEILCLNLRKDHSGFISLRSLSWYDKLLARVPNTLRVNTGNPSIDANYFSEAKTNTDRELLTSGEFGRIINEFPMLTSLAIRDTGISASLPLDEDKQLEQANVERLWVLMGRLAGLF